MAGWTDLRNLIKDEIIQRREEGCDVSGFDEELNNAENDEELMAVYRSLSSLNVAANFPYDEPSDLESISSGRSGIRRQIESEELFLDKLNGAWLGRIAGCMLGKPVEGWSRDIIASYLKSIGEHPLLNYVSYVPDKVPDGIWDIPLKAAGRGLWKNAICDDDTNYTALALKIMEERGTDFSTADVGKAWHDNLPYSAVCTAERQAYLNLANGLPIGEVPRYLNPYREWIGAQIRADFWGYCAPGRPVKAAEFAYRDAALSHVKNGIYGEMFCAAAISTALVTDDIMEIVSTALDVIPPNSRLAETVNDCLRWRRECESWEQAFNLMLGTYYGKYSWVHTNNNLAIVLTALLFGWPDFENVITISVMQGMDTDCNGATAGSIIGAALGAKSLPPKWIEPLGGQLDTSICGWAKCDIDDLARRTLAQAHNVLLLP